MSESEHTSGSEDEVVAVTENGQATIPKRFREKIGIEAPGKVLFRETEDGDVVVKRVPSPEEMRGFAAQQGASTEQPATEMLREKRKQDRRERDTDISEEG